MSSDTVISKTNETKLSDTSTTKTESICLLALLMSLVALSIDVVLPALPNMAMDLGLVNKNDIQLVLSVLFLGLGFGQVFYGPLSDSVGRKPAIFVGLSIFILGSLISYFSKNFEFMLLGRLLQGFGAAGPRIVSVALVRDQFEGRLMAKVMSMVMTAFILVPAIAPSLGQLILNYANWRKIYLSLLVLGLIAFIWLAIRQRETLPKEKRAKFSFRKVIAAVKEVIKSRESFAYILCSGFVSGGFVGYLNSTQQIFHDIYDKGKDFPFYFGVLALAIGCASFVNSRIVVRIGMEKLVNLAARTLFLISTALLVGSLVLPSHLPFAVLLSFMLFSFFCIGILFANLNTLAISPMGHIAGTASAVIGSLQTLISVMIGYFIGQQYNETLVPLLTGFTVLSLVVSLILWQLNRSEIHKAQRLA